MNLIQLDFYIVSSSLYHYGLYKKSIGKSFKGRINQELISIEDISAKLSHLTSYFHGFFWEDMKFVSLSYLFLKPLFNHLLSERIVQLEKNAVNISQYHRHESLEINQFLHQQEKLGIVTIAMICSTLASIFSEAYI